MTDAVQQRIADIVNGNDVVLFMKGTPLFPQCGFSSRAIAILEHLGVNYETVDVLQDQAVRQDYRPCRRRRSLCGEGRVRELSGHEPGGAAARSLCGAGRTHGRGASRLATDHRRSQLTAIATYASAARRRQTRELDPVK